MLPFRTTPSEADNRLFDKVLEETKKTASKILSTNYAEAIMEDYNRKALKQFSRFLAEQVEDF